MKKSTKINLISLGLAVVSTAILLSLGVRTYIVGMTVFAVLNIYFGIEVFKQKKIKEVLIHLVGTMGCLVGIFMAWPRS